MDAAVRKMCWAISSCLAVCASVAAAQPANGAETVTLFLRPTVTVGKTQVSVADVAALEGGPTQLRQSISELDLGELTPTAPTLEISAEQVSFRLRLAGFEPGQFRLQGATRASVRLVCRNLTDQDILAAAIEAVQKRVTHPRGDIAIEPAQPIQNQLVVPSDCENWRLQAEIAPGSPTLGRVRVEVALYADDARQSSVSVILDVKSYRRVAFCMRPVAAGEALTPDILRFERRAVDASLHHLTTAEELSGRRACRPLAIGQAITKEDVEASAADSPVLLKQRDFVRLLVQVGHLQVTALGEVMQDGRAGQLIRVRNVDSNNVVVGRVVDHSTVEVEHGGVQP